MTDRAVGIFTIEGEDVTFDGYNGQGNHIVAKGSVSPGIPPPDKVFSDKALLTYDSIDTLPGRHDIVSSGHGSYAGKEDCTLRCKPQFPESDDITFKAVCSLPQRTLFGAGSVEFSITK
jgi:hypothetical protein